MDFVYADENRADIDYFRESVDFETGDEDALNDFEITTSILKKGYTVYAPGTEWGGIVEYLKGTNTGNVPVWKGHTWRGLLMQDIIEPPAGSDYRTVSGEANGIIKNLLSGVLGGFFRVPDRGSGLSVSSYQFPLFCKVGTGIMDMLHKYGYRLSIHAEKEVPGEPYIVYCEAVPAEKVAGEFNADNKVPMTFIDNGMGVNHLVCMGSGELQERQRIDLYLQPDGSIGKTRYYTGFAERKAYYDYGNAQSLEDLEENGRKRLKEIASGKAIELKLPDRDYEIGDVACARYREHDLYIERRITRKILRRTETGEEIEYKVEGD